MITELFLNLCFILMLNKNTLVRKNKVLFRDIYNIIIFYEKKEKTNIPITIKNKLECLKTICELKINDNRLSETIVDSILIGEKFRNLDEFLTSKINENYEDNIIYDGISQVRTRKKLISLLSNYNELNAFLETVKNGSFDCADGIVLNYETFVKKMYSDLMESSRAVEVEASASLNIMEDSYDKVVDLIKKKYDKRNALPTGFDVLDSKILKGGFEKSRLYIFAGGSGSGKSTLLLNFIINDLLNNNKQLEELDNFGNPKKKVHLYITLENLVDETLMRSYQCMYEKTDIEFLREINSSDITNQAKYVKEKIIEKIKNKNTTVIFKYFPKFSISPTDIMMLIDDVISQYGKDCIKGLYVDYLDLLKLDTIKYDQYRLELSHITSNLKDIAVQYAIPVITLSQLTRDVYKGNLESKDLSMAMIGESAKKIDHADFIAIMTKDKYSKIVHMNVGKNRNGLSDVSLEFKIDFEMFKFLNGYFSVSNKKSDEEVVNNSPLTFSFDDEDLNVLKTIGLDDNPKSKKIKNRGF